MVCIESTVNRRIASSGMWRLVDLLWTDVSEERIASIFRGKNPRARNQREQVAATCKICHCVNKFLNRIYVTNFSRHWPILEKPQSYASKEKFSFQFLTAPTWRPFVRRAKKCKVVPVLNWALRHEDVRENGGIAPPFLTSTLEGDERSASRPGRFTPGEKVCNTHSIGGWVGSRADLDAVD
jgi:hypothetical protein